MSLTTSKLPPATAISDNSPSIGSAVAWTNTTNIYADDTTYASVSGVTATQWLKATNFSASIPAGSTILGISVEVKAYSTGTKPFKVSSIKLIIGGSISGSNLNSGSVNLTATPRYDTYGSSSTLWGLTPSDTDVNDSTFGVGVGYTRASGKGANVVYVDYITVQITYNPPSSGGGASHYYRQQQRHRQPNIIVPQLITDLEPYRERFNRIENRLAT